MVSVPFELKPVLRAYAYFTTALLFCQALRLCAPHHDCAVQQKGMARPLTTGNKPCQVPDCAPQHEPRDSLHAAPHQNNETRTTLIVQRNTTAELRTAGVGSAAIRIPPCCVAP